MSISSSNITIYGTPSQKGKNEKSNKFQELELIKSISCLIEGIIQRNITKKKFPKKSIFFIEEEDIPNISIYTFIFYIYSYLNLELSTIILTIITINRFLEQTKDQLSKNNFYKLFISSCLLNSKQNEDYFLDYELYAKAGKIDKNELIFLENEFFKMIDYKLFVKDEVYRRYYDFFKNRVRKVEYS